MTGPEPGAGRPGASTASLNPDSLTDSAAKSYISKKFVDILSTSPESVNQLPDQIYLEVGQPRHVQNFGFALSLRSVVDIPRRYLEIIGKFSGGPTVRFTVICLPPAHGRLVNADRIGQDSLRNASLLAEDFDAPADGGWYSRGGAGDDTGNGAGDGGNGAGDSRGGSGDFFFGVHRERPFQKCSNLNPKNQNNFEF